MSIVKAASLPYAWILPGRHPDHLTSLYISWRANEQGGGRPAAHGGQPHLRWEQTKNTPLLRCHPGRLTQNRRMNTPCLKTPVGCSDDQTRVMVGHSGWSFFCGVFICHWVQRPFWCHASRTPVSAKLSFAKHPERHWELPVPVKRHSSGEKDRWED